MASGDTMTTTEILTILLTSSLVSSAVTFLLRYFFERKQEHLLSETIEKIKHDYEMQVEDLKHQHDITIEKLKAELLFNTSVKQMIEERKISNYPKLVELIYRIRNIAREFTLDELPSVSIDELRDKIEEFNDLLYQYRSDLERDGVFSQAHSFKNVVNAFILQLRDIQFKKLAQHLAT